MRAIAPVKNNNMKRATTIKCDKCGKRYKSVRGLIKHKVQTHPQPKPVPKKHVCYIDLADSFSWGRSMTNEEAKHPSKEELSLGALYMIARELRHIKNELRKEKRIV